MGLEYLDITGCMGHIKDYQDNAKTTEETIQRDLSTWDNLSFNKGKNNNGFKPNIIVELLKMTGNQFTILKTG